MFAGLPAEHAYSYEQHRLDKHECACTCACAHARMERNYGATPIRYNNLLPSTSVEVQFLTFITCHHIRCCLPEPFPALLSPRANAMAGLGGAAGVAGPAPRSAAGRAVPRMARMAATGEGANRIKQLVCLLETPMMPT